LPTWGGTVQTVAFTFALLIAWYAARTLVVVGGATLLVGRTRRRIVDRAYAPGQLPRALRQAAGVLLFDAAIIVLVGELGWIRFAPSTVAATVVTFAVTFVWYEVWFYAIHRLLHETPLYRIHALHHENRVTHPISALSFSLAERVLILAGLIAFSALVSRVLPITLAGLTIYGLLNHVLAVLGHSNVEVYPAGFAERPVGRIWSTVTHHALHHERERGHYGLFTCVLDDLLGTSFADYARAQRRAGR
jgi:lathosterol oxidase